MTENYSTGFYKHRIDGHFVYFEEKGQKILVSSPQLSEDILFDKDNYMFLSVFERVEDPKQTIKELRENIGWVESKLEQLTKSEI